MIDRRLALPLTLLALALPGCGAGHSTSAPTPTELRVTVWPSGASVDGSRSRRLVCPGEATACAAVARLVASDFAPTPPRTACTALYGGAGEARVVGRLRGHPIDGRFNRRDGCAVARWEKVRALLDLAGGRRIEQPGP